MSTQHLDTPTAPLAVIKLAPRHRAPVAPLSTRAVVAILVVLGVLFVAGCGLIAGIATGELPGYAAVAGLAVLGLAAIVTALAWDRTGAQR